MEFSLQPRQSVILLCALALASLSHPSSSFILSVDLGSQFFKAAIVKPGTPFEIVHNTHSKRKTPTAVSFHETVRTFGDDALTSAAKGMPKTPMLFAAQLGRNLTAEGSSLHWLPEKFFPYNLEVGEWGGLRFRHSEEVAYSVEEAAAHVLTFAKQIAEEAADGAKVSETILTVPSDATFNRRQALLAAAEIGGLPRPHLMHETSAAALQRSLDLDLSSAGATGGDGANDTNDTENSSPVASSTVGPSKQKVLFYNMGARHVEACIVEYRDAKHMGKSTVAMDMLGCGNGDGLGGHQVDMIIAQKMLEVFQSKQPKLADGIIKSVRALRKLEKEAASAKHVLSANKDGQFRVESLFEDTDFTAAISRVELEKWCAELFASLTKPIELALAASSTTIDELDGVEMIGGGWRIPRVQALLSEYLQSKRSDGVPLILSQHVNGEEGIATGAAFYGANNSVSFRTKKIFFTDTTPHRYTLVMEPANLSQPHEAGWSSTVELFPANSPLLSKKTVKVHQAFDIKASLLENDVLVHVWELQGAHQAATEKYAHLETPLTTLKFELDSSGVLQLNSASAIFDEPVVATPVAEVNGTVGGTLADNASADAAADAEKGSAAEEGGAKEGSAEEGEAKEADASKAEAPEAEAPEAEEPEVVGGHEDGAAKDEATESMAAEKKKRKVRKLKVPLDVADHQEGLVHRIMSVAEKAEAKGRVEIMAAADAEVHRMQAAKNVLEAFIYETREKLSDDADCLQVSTEEEREAVVSQANSLEEWLYDDGSMETSAAVFEEKHKALQAGTHPILRRAYELTQRPDLDEVVEKMRLGVNQSLTYVENNMTWVSAKEREGVSNLTEAFEAWYVNVTEQQKTRPLTEEPAFFVGDARRRLQKIQSEAIRLTKIKKIDYDYSKYGEGKYGGSGGYGGGYGYDDPKMRAYYDEMFRNFSGGNGTNGSDFWKNRNFSNFSKGSNDSDYMRSFYEYAAKNASGADANSTSSGAGAGAKEEQAGEPEADHEEL